MTLTDSMYDYRPEQNKSKLIDKCQECGNYIYECDEYYDIKGFIICEECINRFKGGD